MGGRQSVGGATGGRPVARGRPHYDWLPAAHPRLRRRDGEAFRLALVLGALTLLLGALTLWLDGGEAAHGNHALRNALVGVVVAAWGLEIAGVPWPRPTVLVIVGAAVAALMALGWDLFTPIILIGTVGWAAYAAGTRREGLFALAFALGSLIPPFFIRWENQEDWISWAVGVAFAWVSMRALVAQQRTAAELRAAQAEIARQSAAEERRRIAREVHDVIAHSLSITMLHLTGARHILGRDPRRAAEALAQAEHLGRQSLADIRRTVGLLAGEGDAGPRPNAAPLPGAADIAELVAGYARAGLDARLDSAGDPARLSPAAGLDLYRIAQEALANVAKHAPGARVAVTLTIGDRLVTLRIQDGGPQPGSPPIVTPDTAGGSGLGLVGMRERVARLGGGFAAGQSGPGWLVECVIPLEAGGRESGSRVVG